MSLIFPNFVGSEQSTRRPRPLWWVNPAGLIVGVIIPVYILSCLFAEPSLQWAGWIPNYINLEVAIYGLMSLGLFTFGSLIGTKFPVVGRPISTISPKYLDRASLIAFAITIFAYFIFLFPLMQYRDELLQFIMGSTNIRFRHLFNQLPGITSLMMAGNVALSLLSARMALFESRPSKLLMRLAYLTLLCTVIRAFLNSERMALIEAIFAIAIAPLLFRPQRGFIKRFMPFIGIIGLFVLFSSFEFFRSWQYYQQSQGNFLYFAMMRFLGYYVTSINNGAGLMEFVSPLGYPALSGAWFYKFPLFGPLGIDFGIISPMQNYLEYYGREEFNNPGGMFVLMIDFGVFFGGFAMFFYGVVAGILFRSFTRARLLGLLLFPLWLAGVSDLLRLLYWSETRMFSVVITSLFLILILRLAPNWEPRQSPS